MTFIDIATAFQIVLEAARTAAAPDDERLQEACNVLEDLAANEYGED